MGFSQYCRGYLDLTNFVVRSHRWGTAKLPRRVLWLSLADSLEFGNLGIYKSRNLEIWESGIKQVKRKMRTSRMQIRPARNVGKVLISREQTSRHHLGQLWQCFPLTGNMQNIMLRLIFFFGCPIGCHFPGLGSPLGSFVGNLVQDCGTRFVDMLPSN